MNKPKNYQQIAREILDSNDFEPMQVNIAPKHMQRIEGVAESLDLTVSEAVTFMLYAYFNDMEMIARQQQLKTLNNN